MTKAYDRVLTALTYIWGPMVNDWVNTQEGNLGTKFPAPWMNGKQQHAPNTVGIVQCKVDFYVNVIRVLSQTCLKYCCVKYCELIYNVLQNEERILPPDTL